MTIASAVAKKRDEVNAPKRCKLGSLFWALDWEDKEALVYAISAVAADQELPLNERMFTIAWLVGVLKDNGHSIGKTVISDHLAGRCACDRSQ